jgi:hypothetical protein
MRLSHFVTTSSLVLSGWLALTFVSEVPARSYPKLEKHAGKSKAKPGPLDALQAAAGALPEDSGVLSLASGRD